MLTTRVDVKTGGGRCHACKAAIVWALTDKGKRMPLDEQPTLDGKFVLWFREGAEVDGIQRVSSVSSYEIQTGKVYAGPKWRAHWVSCPQASLFGKSKNQTGGR